jgi:hypothetical protein
VLIDFVDSTTPARIEMGGDDAKTLRSLLMQGP